MKKVTRKVKQALSILLVAAMVITMVPQNTLAVSAEEAVETETVETTVDETKETTSETENVDETGASDEDADAEESEEGEADEETEEDEKLEEEIVEEETEEGIKKGADGFEAMTAGVNTVEYAYADEAVTITDSNEPRQTKNDTAYAFKVAAKNSYQIDSVKAYVDYVSETEHGAEVTLTDKGSGNYEIGADEVNKYDGKTIKVVIKASKITYDVTFAENADVTVTIVKDAVESALPDSRIVAVEKDGSVSFKVALTAAAEEAGKTLKSVKSGEDDVPVSDSVYTLSNITEAKTITITTEGPKKYELKFAQDRAEAKVVISNIAQSGYSASIDDVKLTTAEAKTAASGLVEKKDVTFTVGVADDSIYKVKSVTSSEGTVSTKNGVYTLKDVEGEEPVTVTVTTELDETRCNVLEFAIGEAGLEDSFTATVDTAGSYTAEDKKNKILYDAKADKAIVVTAASGYKITAIKLDGKTLETKHTEEVIEGEKEDAPVKIDGSGNWAFTVKYEAASKEKHTVTVCTDAEGLREEKTVTFFNNTAYLNLAVTTDDKIVRTKGDTYQVKEGATLLKFAITTSNNIYKPCFMVHAIGLEESDIRLTGKVAGDKETTYNYTVTANKIKGDASITISQMLAVDQYSVTVKYPTDDIASVKFIAEDGTELTPVSNSEAGTTTASVNNVIEGNKVKVVVKAKECYKIKEASTVVGDEDPKKSTVDATEYSYEVTATANTETTITTEALTKAVLLEGENIIAPNANGQYDVAYGDGKTYTAEVRLGGEPVALDDVKVATENATTKAVKNDKKADITLGAEDAGKEVTVVLTVGTGDNAKEYPIKLKLAAAPKEVAVTGVKSGKLTQNVGTVKEYPVTLNPAGAAQTLAAKVDGTGVTAVIENGKLKVTVANTAEAKADLATITIYDTTDTEKELKGGEIKVTTTQLLEKVKPTVALKSATDIDLVLTLGSKLNEDEVKALASDAKLYYKVVVTPEDTKNTNLKEAQTVYVERTAATNDETITVFKPEVTQGNGGAANFNVEVTLAQTKTADEPAKDDDFEFATAAVTAKVATKAPYFTTKLGSKKLNGGKAYTGQTDVEVAQITFDKDTTWTNLQVDDADSGLNAEVVGDKLVLGYNSNPITVNPGKYDVTVKAVDDGDDNKLHVATTTVKVEIVRGIEELFITAPETLYKKDNKTKASFKADVSYNFGNPDWVPKTKKVTWTVTNTDGKDLSPANAKLITVKNGTVTVDKNYVVSANKAENKFRLNVKAADYKGNTVCAWADFEITSQAAELGDVIIVNGNGHDGWTLVDVTKPVKADELERAYAVVLKSGIATKSYYTEEGLAAVKADAEVTFKSSNKGIVIDADGMITVAKPAKNVKITVTATDGSKAFKTITLKEVGYTAAEDIGLIINSEYGSWYNLEDKDLSFYGPKDAPFVLIPVLKHSDYGLIPTGHACTDCTVSVKNAKIVAKDVTLGFYGIIATGSPITITLQSKSLNKKVEYKLTNKSIANATANAPKLKTTDKLIGGSYYVPEEPRTQTVTYTLPKEYAGKFIQITSDYNDYYKNDKNELRYNAFEYACDEIGTIVRVNSAGQVTLTFKAVDYYYTNIPAGSYKLNYLVGSYDIDGNFVAETKPGSVTLKAVAQKAVKAKLNTSYTMSLKEGARVGLALNNKNAKLNASNLQNANIKGQENEFTTYFELDGNYLKLKDTLSPEQLEYIISNAAKNDLTGWVTYSYTDGRGDYQGEGEAQIKVSFKDLVQKYSLSKATVLDDATSATVTAYAGKETTDIAYVLVTDGEFTAEADNGNSSTITLTRNGTWKKSNEVTLRILPKDSYYVAKVTDVKADATKFAEAMNTYGIEVKTTITAKDFESTTGKITINSKDAAQTFTAKELDVDYEVVDKKGYYVVEVPYTTTVESVAEFTVDAVNDADKAMFKVTVDKANKKLVVKLDKAALAENVKKTKDTGVVYGQKRKVEFTLTFADKAAAEKIKLNLTLPKETTANYESVTKAVQKALRDVEEGVYYKGIVDREEVAEINVSYVNDLISALVPADSDTKLNVSVADPENDVELPTSGAFGSVEVKVTLTDLTKDATSANKELNLTLAKLDKAPYELLSALTSYLSGLDNHVSNNTTYEEIVKGARDAVEITKYPNLRLVLENFNKEEATLNNSGSIRGVFYILDIYDEYRIDASLYASIPRIKNLSETNSAITNGWNDLTSDVTFLKNVKQADGKDAVMNWVKSYINNDAISVAWKQVEGKDVFEYVASSSKATGTVYGTIILTAEGEDPVEIKLSEKDSAAVVARRETLDEVDTAVGNAVNAVVVSNSTTKDDYVNAVKAVIENPSFTITWKEDKFEKTDATTSKAGSIKATLVLSDADNAEAAAKEYMINETIDMLQQKTLAEAQAAGAEALTALAVSNSITQANVLDEVIGAVNLKYATVTWKQVAKDKDKPTVLSDDFEKVDATASNDGSIKGTIVITLDDETVEVQVNLTIPKTGLGS